MSSVQIKKSYEGKSDVEIYEAVLKAIPNAGLTVWKKRELARLALGVCQQDGQEVRCNVVVSMFDGSVTTTAEADDLPDSKLTPIAERIFSELDKLLV
jgi:hypothetical protein